MCRTTNLSYRPPVEVSSLGIQGSDFLKPTLAKTPEMVHSSNNNSGRKNSSRHPHITVKHGVYHDHALDLDYVDERPARGGVTTPFPIRLHKMLDKMEADGHADVISWQPHGRCFVVRKPKEFKELLPVYFKLSKMSSFQRQLNLYGFLRLTRGRDKNGYYHEYFLRGKPSLSHKIQRTKVKGTGVRARSNPAAEPHLWDMPWVGTDHNGSASSNEAQSANASPASFPKLQTKQFSSLPVHTSSAFLPPLTGSVMRMKQPEPVPSMAPSSSWAQQFFQDDDDQEEAVATRNQEKKKQQPQQPMFSAADQDIVLSFGGKSFHYLDPEVMAREAQLRQKQYDACQRDDMQAFMSNLELDNLYTQIDDEAVDNDDAFMDMLERVIE